MLQKLADPGSCMSGEVQLSNGPAHLFKLGICLEALLQHVLDGLYVMVCNALHLLYMAA